jgi:acetyl-CoA carboxylase biotin carboxylase subunit
MFKKILIANRGEIAVRVIRACRELGVRSAAVFSAADRGALHVRMADEAYPIGRSAATESYLNISKLIETAQQCGAEAIHPGYGFLSENAEFARACQDAGVKFIGPSAEAMKRMGNKIEARRIMQAAGGAIVPGTIEAVSAEQASSVAEELGYPVLIKAAAGGGGKGMRLVGSPEELTSAYQGASSEAERAFGDGAVYVEKALESPRHIEVQVLADEHGNVVHLGERECSIQRRHQKVLEESPSPLVSPRMRQQMGEAATRAALAVGYTNAGTVEFLVDERRNFYFLEMNTRLQVEHPVTEAVTGLDLVHWQIRIAAGERLPFAQDQIALRGHAIECRIYAEDPDNNFFPSAGKITLLETPSGIRHDSGIYAGWTVPLEYDPLLAKLIAYGATREEAIARMARAVEEYVIGGIKTNLPLFRQILADENFRAGKTNTSLLEKLVVGPSGRRAAEEKIAAVAAALVHVIRNTAATSQPLSARNGGFSSAASPWKQAARREALREK